MIDTFLLATVNVLLTVLALCVRLPANLAITVYVPAVTGSTMFEA